MRIVNILFNISCFHLKYSTAAAGIIVLFFCSPLWGYFPDLHQQRLPVSLPGTCKDPIAEDQLIRLVTAVSPNAVPAISISSNGRTYPPMNKKKCEKNIKSGNRFLPQFFSPINQLNKHTQTL